MPTMHDAKEFSSPENNRCSGDDYQPVAPSERNDIEKSVSAGDNHKLTDKNHKCNCQEAGAFFKMQCRTTGAERTGVKHIPELQKDKEREEKRQLICRKFMKTTKS